MGERKVLMIEDYSDLHEIVRQGLKPYPDCRLVSAYTLDEGSRLFDDNQPDLVLIVMDGCVDHDSTLDSLPLIQAIRKKGFHGTMLAASSDGEFRKEMLLAGCDREIKQKMEVPFAVMHFLALPFREASP